MRTIQLLFISLTLASCNVINPQQYARDERDGEERARPTLTKVASGSVEGRSGDFYEMWRYTWAYLECDVEPHEYCNGEIYFDVITANNEIGGSFQLCRWSYLNAHESGYYKTIGQGPILWFEGDVESPDRIKSARTAIHATGNRFDLGARVRLENITYDVLTYDVPNDTRRALGCLMPEHG